MSKHCDFELFKKDWIKRFSDYIIMNLDYLDGSIKVYERMTYRDEKEIKSFTIDVSLLVDTGDIFKKTLSYNIYIDEDMDFIKYTQRYIWEYKNFSKHSPIKVAEYLVNNVITAINKSKDNSNKITKFK